MLQNRIRKQGTLPQKRNRGNGCDLFLHENDAQNGELLSQPPINRTPIKVMLLV